MADGPDDVLDRVDRDRRDFLKKVLAATVSTVPTIVSFSMDSLSVYEAHAQQGSNVT